MTITTEHMQMLAQLERDMDCGIRPFVVCAGRWAFSQDLLDECDIHSGQTVSQGMITTLMQMTFARLETQLALEKAAHHAQTLQP